MVDAQITDQKAGRFAAAISGRQFFLLALNGVPLTAGAVMNIYADMAAPALLFFSLGAGILAITYIPWLSRILPAVRA